MVEMKKEAIVGGPYRSFELDGKSIAYGPETVFLVQVGRYKGSYKTRCSVTGNAAQAIIQYNGINIGNGYKKRLVMPGSSKNKGVLARQMS